MLAGPGALLLCVLAAASPFAAVAPLGHIAVGGLVAFLVGLIVLAARHEVRVVRMDAQRVWTKGASPALLDTLGPAFGAPSPADLPQARTTGSVSRQTRLGEGR